SPTAPTSPVAPASRAPAGTAEAASSYVLQAGAFRDQDDAEGMRAKLALIGYEARVVEAEVDGGPMYRVRVGPYADLATMNDVRARLAQVGIEASVVRRRCRRPRHRSPRGRQPPRRSTNRDPRWLTDPVRELPSTGLPDDFAASPPDHPPAGHRIGPFRRRRAARRACAAGAAARRPGMATRVAPRALRGAAGQDRGRRVLLVRLPALSSLRTRPAALDRAAARGRGLSPGARALPGAQAPAALLHAACDGRGGEARPRGVPRLARGTPPARLRQGDHRLGAGAGPRS